MCGTSRARSCRSCCCRSARRCPGALRGPVRARGRDRDRRLTRRAGPLDVGRRGTRRRQPVLGHVRDARRRAGSRRLRRSGIAGRRVARARRRRRPALAGRRWRSCSGAGPDDPLPAAAGPALVAAGRSSASSSPARSRWSSGRTLPGRSSATCRTRSLLGALVPALVFAVVERRHGGGHLPRRPDGLVRRG